MSGMHRVSTPLRVCSFLHEPSPVEDFLDLPVRLYRGDAAAPPRDPAVDRAEMAPGHPFFREGEERRFLALQGDRPVARCAAMLTRRLQVREPGFGLIGFFESEDDAGAAQAVLGAARAWLAGRGCRRVRAPVDRDTWHRYRLLVEGFDGEPVTMEPYNPPWYPALFERAGFVCAARYETTETGAVGDLAHRFTPFLDRCLRRGYRFRELDLERFEEELDRLHRVTLEIFSENYGYSPTSREEFLSLYCRLRTRIDPAFVLWAVTARGTPAGYIFAFPDPRSAGSPEGPALNIKTLGVGPRWQGRGVGLALTAKLYLAAQAHGFRRVRHCLMKSDNTSRRYGADAGRVIKRFALYEAPAEGGGP